MVKKGLLLEPFAFIESGKPEQTRPSKAERAVKRCSVSSLHFQRQPLPHQVPSKVLGNSKGSAESNVTGLQRTNQAAPASYQEWQARSPSISSRPCQPWPIPPLQSVSTGPLQYHIHQN